MSNEVHDRESTVNQERISKLTPAQREMLAKRLRGEGPKSQPKSVIKHRPTLDYPITAEQEHLWLLHQVDPNVYYFNHTHAYHLKGDLNIDAVERAINEMVRRHENFRTSLPEIDGKPRAVVAPQLRIPLERVDVPEFPVEDRHERLQALVTAHTCRPFDISNGPMVRAILFRITEQEHAVMLTLHHLITDFVSYDLVDSEFFALYEAFSRELPSPLPELPVQFGDFAYWFDQWMKTEEAARQTDYWLRKLADLPRLDLVTDKPRPHTRSFSAVRLTWILPDALWVQFKQLCMAENVTRFTAFLVVFAMLLREYCGKDDIPIATPVSSRKHRETQSLIGYFLNTIVYRLDLSGNPSFRELLQRTRVITLEAMANSDLPFEVLLNKLQIERDPSRAPLVDTSYAFGNDHRVPQLAAGTALEEIREFDAFYQSAYLDVNLGVNDNTDHGVVVYDYLVDLFLNSTGERMLLHFQRLFAQAAADPGRRLSDFLLLNDHEQQQILIDWNKTAAPYPSTQTIQSCFAAQVSRDESAIALRSPYENLTYGELNQRANHLAHRLIRGGMKSESVVAILMERSTDMIVAMLAVLKAGGAYLPLHPAYPLERMSLIMEEAGASALLLDRTTEDRELTCAEVVVVDNDPYLMAEDDSDPDIAIDPDQLAYAMYTSGSTGTPKGVAVTHRNVVSLAFDRSWREGSLERALFHSSHAFDASTFEIWAPLLQGKQVIIAPPGELEVADYKHLFQAEKITAVFLTTALFNALVQEAPECFSSVPEVLTGGEAASPMAFQRIHQHCPETLVCHVYGPTETTTFATHYAVSNPDKLTGNVPIGSAFDNHQIYVLDSALKPVPVSIPGELFIAGAGVARGYLKRPDLTAERFVPNPFGDFGGRMYRTGDRVRWREDGQIEFLGRNDQQIKLRGFRIELAEIQAALVDCSGVGQAVVIVNEDRKEGKRLVAYVVPAPGHSLNAAELRESLSSTLPSYMVPAFITILPSLPLNSNGKLDRKALPSPEVAESSSGRMPRTHAEEVLCSLMVQVLGVPRATLDDNFFALGGDSILAFQLVSRARQAGVIVSLRDVFEQETIESLAAVSQSQDVAAAVPDVGVGPMPPTPMTCWFLESGGTLHRFSQSIVLQVPANLKRQDLVRVLQTIINHHDALRLRFTGAQGPREDWRLDIQTQDAVNADSCLRVIDIAGLSGDACKQKITQEGQAATERLSAENGIMLQAVWFNAGRTAPGHLLLTIHHVVVDGVSWRILVPDLMAAWAAISAGNDPVLEPSPFSFRGWVERLSREALNPERMRELSFWTDALKNAPELVPGGQLDPSRDTLDKARQIVLTLPPKVTAPLLNQVASTFHTRINDVLLTGLVLSVLQWQRQHHSSDNTSVLIDLEGHGRERIFEGVDLSRTVGFFTIMFPLHLDVGPLDLEEAWAGGKALGSALKSIKEQLRAVPDNGIGYGLLRYLNPETAPALSGLTKSQIDFNYLGRFPVAETTDWSPSDAFTGGLDPEMSFHHPLEIDSMVVERAAGPELTALWTWIPGILSEQDVQLMAEGWFHMLEALVQLSEQPGVGGLTPSDLPLVALSQSEIDRLENEYGDIEDILPLSPVQEGMLFHAFYDASGPDVYNVQIALRLEGPLDEKLLEAATKALLSRHKNLSVAFKYQDLDRPVQIIPRDFSVPWDTLDLSALAPQERERSWAEFVKRDGLVRFDPGTSPLFMFHLVRFAPKEFRLLITTHHILIDGWSTFLMIDELQKIYEHHGNASALPRVTAFRDYLTWLTSRDRSSAEAAWREALAGLEEGTRLSPLASLGDPKIPERIVISLDEETTQRLTAQARARNLTVNTIVQGAWAVLLSRHTGQEDVVFGSTVAGRAPEIAGVESMVGLLINTVPTRVRLGSADSFDDLVNRLNQEQSRLLPHQYLGLVEIQRLTKLNELFDTLVVFENFPRGEEGTAGPSGGLRFSLLDLNDAAHYPLTLIIGPSRRLDMFFTYHPDHFSSNFVEILSQRFIRLLTAFATAPDQPVNFIDLLDEQERRQIVVEFNRSHTEYPRNRTMMELFAEQVQRRGEEVAVICDQERISYNDLDHRSNQLARYLKNLGVGPEKLVGISVERSIDMVLAMVGILKAGGAYVPIDPAYPADRFRFMAEDSDIGVLLTQKRLVQRIPQLKAHVVCLDRDWDEIAQQSNQSFQTKVLPEDLAYVIYTSGSTGQPKAAAVSHCSMIRLLRDTNYIQFQGDEVVAQTVNMSFDPSTFEIWGALLNGCRLVIITNEVLLDVERFAAEIVDKGVQVMFLATALFNEVGRLKPAMFNSVKHLLIGGEAIYPVTAAAVLEQGGPERLLNAYGPAECTTFTSWYHIREVARDAQNVPIGQPVANTQLYVLDRNMNLEPVGIMGQLYIGGEGLARGYWRRPELTAERYLPDPYGPPGGRLYTSGDLARWMEDGNLEFFGRRDSQIKIRGFRVELGEIEAALLQHVKVRNCAVLMKTGSSGKQLVAYVSGEANADELKNYLKAKLPEYMVPSVYVMLPELPISTNGKVDRRALPEVEDRAQEIQQDAPETMNAVEELLADIWKDVLGVARVSMHSNFYDLGGHSLLALRVVSRINDYFQAGLSVRTLLEYPVLMEFAQRVYSLSARPAQELEKIAKIGLIVRRMSPEERKAALSKQ
ncbi:MAG TPA: amino acid adenylation domain-containing protein [Candidatus Angelobacter sp.]|nr:amino acid adenylation domain-containing protein [Candidatus Angelobacter sp.]